MILRTDTTSLNGNRLVFTMDMAFILCEVGTQVLCIKFRKSFSLHRVERQLHPNKCISGELHVVYTQ